MIDQEKLDHDRFSFAELCVEFLMCLDRIQRSADGAVSLPSLSSDLGFLDRAHRWAVLKVMLQQAEARPDLFWPLFVDWWSDYEGWRPHGLTARLRRVHRRQGAYEFMGAENRSYFDSLPEQVQIHRGSTRENPLGISWTQEIAKARWFAQRYAMFGGPKTVVTGVVSKSDVWTVFTDRDEREILCDPKNVRVTKIRRR
jgi:hypothetical protein